MDFLFNGEPGRIHPIRNSEWRINAIDNSNALNVFARINGEWHPVADRKFPPLARLDIKFVIPDVWVNAPGILMLFLPFPTISQQSASDLFSLDGAAIVRWSWPVLEVKMPAAEIVLNSFPLPAQPETIHFGAWFRNTGEEFFELPEMPLQLADTPAECLQMYVKGNFSGNKVRGSIAAEQNAAARFMPDGNFNGKVQLQYAGTDYAVDVREGIGTFELPLPESRPFVLKAFHPALGGCESNYLDPAFLSELDYSIVWGDMHIHSRESDGIGEVETIVRRARDWQNLDFMAFNDHIEQSLSWRRWNQAKWEKLRKIYDRNTVDNEFVIIPGFEFFSYCNLWCFNDEYHTFLNSEFNREHEFRVKDSTTPEGKRQDAQVQQRIAEFTRRPGWLVGYHQLEVLKANQGGKLPVPVQLLQLAHYKRPPETGSMDYLLRGDRVGFFGSTDTHIGLPAVSYSGSRQANSGITAVMLKQLDRKCLHEALRQRRCYASMGSRTLLDTRLNGAVMGTEVTIPEGRSFEFNVRAAGKEMLKSFDIVINGVNVETCTIDQSFVDHTYRGIKDHPGDSFIFARLHLADGRMVWSTPHWLVG